MQWRIHADNVGMDILKFPCHYLLESVDFPAWRRGAATMHLVSAWGTAVPSDPISLIKEIRLEFLR